MILGIGVDILSLARIEGVISRRGAARLAARICSAREQAQFAALADNTSGADTLARAQLRFLSARWAAKEAAYKALPFAVGWKDVELGYAPSGRPLLALVGGAGVDEARSGAPRAISLLATISHDAGVLVAAVVAQEER
ncbi:hypothetical protein VHUM_03422 [Vanrija humicola]|uniref:4'-phosphopantetheinyl transferase domain-containing protein n=1 Tax=Vanrija humicola TaxID=5417 RepID=A0A7D8V3R0_VANHU|nr:hypothetical protein VHUM_03422 [Vanrija humicola]